MKNKFQFSRPIFLVLLAVVLSLTIPLTASASVSEHSGIGKVTVTDYMSQWDEIANDLSSKSSDPDNLASELVITNQDPVTNEVHEFHVHGDEFLLPSQLHMGIDFMYKDAGVAVPWEFITAGDENITKGLVCCNYMRKTYVSSSYHTFTHNALPADCTITTYKTLTCLTCGAVWERLGPYYSYHQHWW